MIGWAIAWYLSGFFISAGIHWFEDNEITISTLLFCLIMGAFGPGNLIGIPIYCTKFSNVVIVKRRTK